MLAGLRHGERSLTGFPSLPSITSSMSNWSGVVGHSMLSRSWQVGKSHGERSNNSSQQDSHPLISSVKGNVPHCCSPG